MSSYIVENKTINRVIRLFQSNEILSKTSLEEGLKELGLSSNTDESCQALGQAFYPLEACARAPAPCLGASRHRGGRAGRTSGVL